MATPAAREAVVPADLAAERAAHERCQECADVDADIVDRVSANAAWVIVGVKRADLRRDIRLEGADAEDQAGECEEQRDLEHHQEMADRHQQRADHGRDALAENAIGEVAADDRRQIGDAGVEPKICEANGCGVRVAEHASSAAFTAP